VVCRLCHIGIAEYWARGKGKLTGGKQTIGLEGGRCYHEVDRILIWSMAEVRILDGIIGSE
jgi:hypothetical protein